jgi:uncharacterized protein YndB with AHSA1/START domain
MRLVLIVVAVVVALLACVWVVGLALPRDHVAARSARFAAPPDQVWALVGDLASYARWAPQVTDVQRLSDQNGHPVYALGGKWAMPLEVEDREAPRRLVVRIVDAKLLFGGTWTWEIAPEGAGSRVTVTERGVIKPPPLRALARFVFGYTSNLDAYLEALGRHLNENVTPSAAASGA